MVISIDEEAFDKIRPISDKTSPESGHRGNRPQHNKGHIKPTLLQIQTLSHNRSKT